MEVSSSSSSPPLTPSRQFMSPLDTSPTNSYREHLRRRTSSFSSNHDRSPVTPRLKHRFSNASQCSNEFPTLGAGGAGGGNLADELEQFDDEEVEEEEEGRLDGESGMNRDGLDGQEEKEAIDYAARDSGVDVSYASSRKASPRIKNFSKPFRVSEKPPDEDEAEVEEKLSPELEDAMASIARMTAYTSTAEDPLITRIMALLQDLGNQSALETAAQRLTTSTNSLTNFVGAQSKSLQALSTSLFSPFAFGIGLDALVVEETTPLVDALLQDLPIPDPLPLQGMQKLDRETANVIQTLSQLTDTLQMGKQITNAAARHLRTTHAMVLELRREGERADLARHELAKRDVERGLRERRCALECRDVVAGFEACCVALRDSLGSDDLKSA